MYSMWKSYPYTNDYSANINSINNNINSAWWSIAILRGILESTALTYDSCYRNATEINLPCFELETWIKMIYLFVSQAHCIISTFYEISRVKMQLNLSCPQSYGLTG